MKKRNNALILDVCMDFVAESLKAGVLDTWHQSSVKGHTEYGENSSFCWRVIRGRKYWDFACCGIRPTALEDPRQMREYWLEEHNTVDKKVHIIKWNVKQQWSLFDLHENRAQRTKLN
jgi:hypothetical protein